MTLTIDIGNTSTACAIFRKESIVYRQRIPTPRQWPVGHLHALLRPGWPAKIGAVVVSSVVPALDKGLAGDCRTILGLKALFLDHRNAGAITFKIDRPSELGADRIADCLGALRFFPPPVIIIDSGTATTFDLLNANHEYCGGCILPGIQVAIKSLAENTAKLKEIAFSIPVSPVGTNTTHSIRAGIFYGTIGMLTHLIGLYRAIMGPSSKVIATGGLIRHFKGRVPGIDCFEPDLVFYGLKSACERQSRS